MSVISIFSAMLLTLLGAFLGLFIGFLGGLSYSRHHLSKAQTAQSSLGAEEALQLQSTFSGQVTNQLSSQLRPIYESLHSLSNKVHQIDALQRENLAGLHSQLVSAQQVDQQILQATLGLDSALRNTSKRGTWGEVSLRRVLEMSGLTKHIDFAEQVSLNTEVGDTGAIPDVVVHLPNQAALIIDAKVPLDAYLQVTNLQDTAQLKAHAAAVQRHVTVLAKRQYSQKLSQSIDSVILFMPSEALVSASLEADPTLFEKALQQGIIVVGPAGLMTLLRSVGHLWARQSLTEDAQQILKLGTTLTTRLNKLSNLLADLGKNLSNTVESYNRVIASFESRFKSTVRSISALEASVTSELDGLESQVRYPSEN